MPISHPLPIRRITIQADCAEELAALQPERPRAMVQLRRGDVPFQLQELSWGQASIQCERWSSGIRLQQDRPAGYVCFVLITRLDGEARWMGAPIEEGNILRIVEGWDLVTTGRLDYIAFAVGRTALEQAEVLMWGGDDSRIARENRIGRTKGFPVVARQLRRTLDLLSSPNVDLTALACAHSDLIQLAIRLDRTGELVLVKQLAGHSNRSAMVGRIEAYLRESGDLTPRIPTVCEVAGVSERTLEYAFRERLGVTPMRYLKLHRLNLVHRRLESAGPEHAGVTEVALACGFYDLGRFAGEYRALFGELPSETLARSRMPRSDARRRALRSVRPLRQAFVP